MLAWIEHIHRIGTKALQLGSPVTYASIRTLTGAHCPDRSRFSSLKVPLTDSL